jgi:MscS family membrane protein
MNTCGNAATPLFVLLLAVMAPIAVAQIPGLPSAGDGPAAEPTDPMGRGTPRGAIVAFSRAAHREDFIAAARYLQLQGSQRQNVTMLVNALRTVIDRDLHEALTSISDAPAGSLEDGLPEDQEHIGPLELEGGKFYLKLVRVRDGENGLVWLVSSETLRQIPAIASVEATSWVERNMPASLLARELAGISLAHWIVLVCLLAVPFLLLYLIAIAVRLIGRRYIGDPARRQHWDRWFSATHWPVIAVFTLLIQFVAIPRLGYPLTFRAAYARLGLIAMVILLTWLTKRVLELGFTDARGMLRGRSHASTKSLMLLVERLIKAILVVVSIVIVLILLGVESKTALAALGVVGVALALGAQKTVENLLGGVFLLSDKALAVGDYCRIGNQSGTVEDVTLRSVRIRTSEQSLVSLPAGSLAQTGIENFATREKFLVQTMLRLRYGTTVGQVRQVLEGARGLITQNANIERETSDVRLVNFSAQAIELELFAYVLTADAEKFRAVREELLLQLASLVEAAGSALTPTQFIRVDS